MSQSNKFIRLSAKTLLLSMGLTLVACGGGGGGSSSNTIPSAAVVYVGSTSEATITTDADAIDLTKAFIVANQQNVGGSVAGATISSSEPLSSDAKNILNEQLKQQVISSLNNKNATVTGAGAIITGNCTLYNELGITDDGSVSETVFTETNSSASGKLTYNNLCLYDLLRKSYTIINGDVYFSVAGDFSAEIIDSMVLNIPQLTVIFKNTTTNVGFTETISEYISFAFEYEVDGDGNVVFVVVVDGDGNSYSYPKLVSLTTYVRSDFDVNGTVYRFEETDVYDANSGSSSITLKFYHPTIGSVEYVDTLSYSGACGNLPDLGSLVVKTASTQYTVTPDYATTYNIADCGTYTAL